jgi:hypothetical protein
VCKAPKVSKEARQAQTEKLYAKVGRIVVLGEHLNFAMSDCCRTILEVRGLSQNYAQTVLVGQNLENMRRTWESLIKVFYAGDADAIGMIDHLSKRLDNINPAPEQHRAPAKQKFQGIRCPPSVHVIQRSSSSTSGICRT